MPQTKGKSKLHKTSLKQQLLVILKKLHQDEFTVNETSLIDCYCLILKVSENISSKYPIFYLHLFKMNPTGQWLIEQVDYLETKNITESHFFLSNIATALTYKLIKLAPHLYTPDHPSTEPIKNFIKKCHNHIVILSNPRDSLDEVIERVLSEEKNLYHTTHLRSTTR